MSKQQGMLDRESFGHEVQRAAMTTTDPDVIAAALWPLFRRLAEVAWLEGRVAGGKKKQKNVTNPYAVEA